MSTFHLRIIACNRVFYDGECRILVVPALDGEQAIMANHENMVIATKVGEVRFRCDEEAWTEAVVGIGFVHIDHNEVVMLVDTAERPEDIDRVRAEAALERAQEQLRQQQSIEEYHISRASLSRAMFRLKKAGKYEVK